MRSLNANILTRYFKTYWTFIAIALFSYLLLNFAHLFEAYFGKTTNVAPFLAWHNVLELSSVFVSLGVFMVSYYSFEGSNKFDLLIIGYVFLMLGFLDFFHTFSYKGMPDFLIPNTNSNRATTLWIISRFLGGIGLLLASFLSTTEIKIKKWIFSLLAIVFSIGVFITVTYFPQLLPPMYIEGKGLTQLKINLEYVIILILIVTTFRYLFLYNKNQNRYVLIFSYALLMNILTELTFTKYSSVYSIYSYLGHIFKFIAYLFIFFVVFVYNLRKPHIQLKKAQNELLEYADNLNKLVDERTLEINTLNEKFIEDLEFARDLQKSLLPSKLQSDNEVSFDAKYFPAERVGGDFYNIVRLDDDNIGIYIGDVSGHGVTAAMLTVFALRSIKPLRERDDDKLEIIKPSKVLLNLYNDFNSANFRDELYLVMFYGIYNTKQRKLTYSSAGLNTAPMVLKSTGIIYELGSEGFAIFKLMDLFAPNYIDKIVELEPGDKLLFFTDGLTDSLNCEGIEFSEAELRGILIDNAHNSIGDISQKLGSTVLNLISKQKPTDDITYLLMEVK